MRDLRKVGTSWISRKGGILEKGGVDLEKGEYDPLTNYVIALPPKILGPPQLFWSEIFRSPPKIRVDCYHAPQLLLYSFKFRSSGLVIEYWENN